MNVGRLVGQAFDIIQTRNQLFEKCKATAFELQIFTKIKSDL